MAKKATHFGNCQICGSRQKAPGGKIAKHGYVVAGYGFFSGTCAGSDDLPYEISCELVKTYREITKSRIARLQEEITETSTRTTGTAWVQVYDASDWGRKGGYRWTQAEVQVDESSSYPRFFVVAKIYGRQGWADQKKTLENYEYVKTVEAMTVSLNKKYIEQVLEAQIRQGYEHLAWSEERIKSWKLTDLTPVK